MGDRFYRAQLAAIGTCPGSTKKRRSRMAWTDEKREQAVAEYLAAEPTPETSADILKEVADSLGETVNGVRRILQIAEVYVAKLPAKASAKAEGGAKRTSKQESLAALTNAITAVGGTVDEEIINKLTGKAAQYFADILASK